jgi:hypothetical protein
MPRHHPCCSSGTHLRADEPEWEPLLKAVGEHLAGGFMWMYATTLENGTVVHAYKHHDTRRYLFLDVDLQAFTYTACGSYSPTRLDWAIEAALCFWLLSGRAEQADIKAINEAYTRASEVASRAS